MRRERCSGLRCTLIKSGNTVGYSELSNIIKSEKYARRVRLNEMTLKAEMLHPQIGQSNTSRQSPNGCKQPLGSLLVGIDSGKVCLPT